MRAIIIHGAYGNPEENWFPWLKAELEKLGLEVAAPKFPTPEGQNLQNWLRLLGKITPDTILIGHSIACSFVLNILEKQKAKAAFLVAGWVGSLGDPAFDDINRTFFKEFDWTAIRNNCPRITLYGSDNDPYVPLEKERQLAKNLGIELKLVKGAGHFNKKAGYLQFQLLLNDIKEVLKQ
jgi:hypothetical protein